MGNLAYSRVEPGRLCSFLCYRPTHCCCVVAALLLFCCSSLTGIDWFFVLCSFVLTVFNILLKGEVFFGFVCVGFCFFCISFTEFYALSLNL